MLIKAVLNSSPQLAFYLPPAHQAGHSPLPERPRRRLTMGLKGSGTVPPCGTHIAPTLQDLPKVTQLISGRAGPELFCPASLEKDLPALSRVGPAGSPLREAAQVPPPHLPALARGNLLPESLGQVGCGGPGRQLTCVRLQAERGPLVALGLAPAPFPSRSPGAWLPG